jgi:hypothetical protein
VRYHVSKVYHFMNHNGRHGYYESDLIFIDGVPHIVIEWKGNEPDTTLELDPVELVGPDSAESYFYGPAIQDPRPFSWNSASLFGVRSLR